jgi:putative YhdH/YhfP family quinone oxidoreductase
MSERYTAMLVEQVAKKEFTRKITERSVDELPEGELLIRVRYSSLNFKDALSAIGNPGVSRNFPHTPGIDAAGEVVECSDDSFKPGDEVLVTGFDLGMNTAGGFGQYIRIPSKWAVALPAGLSAKEAMVYGTAGFTAGLSLQALVTAGVKPDDGEILVTGATGGVGSVAVALLAKAGYKAVAATGKADQADFLKGLGAADVVSRDVVLEGSDRPMLKERWAGVIDCVGGDYLAAAIKATSYGGTVTCCGLTASPDLNINVFPFILRGVSLLGIDSVECPMEPRLSLWDKLAGDWKLDSLEALTEECGLDALDEKINLMLKGGLKGRTLVNLDM